MKKKSRELWFGVLEAGKRTSPVVRDSSLNTGNPQTLYLFNRQRGSILEYRRDIVEAKLRELDGGEESMVAELESAFQSVRASFTPRGTAPPTPARRTKKKAEPEVPDLDDDQSWPLLEEDPSLMADESPLLDAEGGLRPAKSGETW